jgi:hypothetical protein
MIQQIGIIYGLTDEEVENIPVQEFYSIKDDLSFLSKEPESTNIKREFQINGITYKLKEDLSSITLGEWMDFEAFNKDCINNLSSIMALLYRKEGLTKYVPSEVDEASELFLDNVDIETCLAAFFLFFLFALNYIPSDIQDCSMFQKAELEVMKLKNQLEKQLVV